MSLYFYSDQIIEENNRIDKMLIDEASEIVNGIENVKLAYIPFHQEGNLNRLIVML